MMFVDKLLRIVTKRAHSWSSSLRWCQLMTRVDSMPLVESSQELSQQDKRSESWDQTTNQEARMT